MEKPNNAPNQISAKKIGGNAILTMNGTEKIGSRKVTKEEWEKLEGKVKAYNKRNSEKNLTEIKKLITPAAELKKQEEAKKKAVVKGVKQQVKKASKKKTEEIPEETQLVSDIDLVLELQHKIDTGTLSDEESKKLKKLLDSLKKKEEVVEAKKEQVAAPYVAPIRRGGEH